MGPGEAARAELWRSALSCLQLDHALIWRLVVVQTKGNPDTGRREGNQTLVRGEEPERAAVT